MTMDIRNDHPFTAKEVAWLEGRCQTGRSPRPGCTGCSPSAETRSSAEPGHNRSAVFDQSELAHVGVAVAEQVGAAGEVLHVAHVDLFGLNRNGLLPVALQRRCPGVQRSGVMWPQRLDPGHPEA